MKIHDKLTMIGVQLRKNNQITPTFFKQTQLMEITQYTTKLKIMLQDLFGWMFTTPTKGRGGGQTKKEEDENIDSYCNAHRILVLPK